MAARRLTEQEKALRAACKKLAAATKGCPRISQATKDRYYRECTKIGEAAR